MKKLLFALVLMLTVISVITSCGLFNKGTPEENDYPYLKFVSGYLTEYGGDFVSVELNTDYTGVIPEEIILPNDKNITAISYQGFKDCTTIKSITLPNTVTHIGKEAFNGCTALEKIVLPDNVISIEEKAFEGCTELTSITLPNRVISIKENSFDNTGYYNDFGNWDNDVLYIGNHLIAAMDLIEGECKIEDGTLDIAERAFMYCTSLTKVEVPNSITALPSQSFYGCESLSDVVFADDSKLITIGYGSFDGCRNLTEITIPDSVVHIDTLAFNNCVSLANIIIPENVSKIGERAFEYCTSIISINIPKSVKDIGDGAFCFTSKLENIVLDQENKYYRIIDGNLYSKDAKTLIQYVEKTNGNDSFDVPNGVTKIAYGAFADCDSLRTITLPDTLTTIGTEAFCDCDLLENITIPNGVTVIDDGTFSECDSLDNIVIPNSITEIGRWAFQHCGSLSNITIGKNVSVIYGQAFLQCNSITQVFYAGTQEDWNAIEIDALNECLTNATIHYDFTSQ